MFAATVKIDFRPFPEDLEGAAKHHFAVDRGDDTVLNRRVTRGSILAMLRHSYSNYDELVVRTCEAAGSADMHTSAVHDLRRRVNRLICRRLEWDYDALVKTIREFSGGRGTTIATRVWRAQDVKETA